MFSFSCCGSCKPAVMVSTIASGSSVCCKTSKGQIRTIQDDWQIVVSKQHDYVDFRTGERCKGTLDPGAVHGDYWNDLDSSLKRPHSCHAHSTRSETGVMRNLTALQVVDRAMDMADSVSEEADVLHRHWQGVQGFDPMLCLFEETDMKAVAEDLIQLARDLAHLLMHEEKSLAETSLPCKIFGDIHGQFRDLLLLLHHYGWPVSEKTCPQGPSFIFNGDWVDRGKHQLETVALIFSLKLLYPSRVYLNRGNHEDGMMNMQMGEHGFLGKCEQRFGEAKGQEVFVAICQVWDRLPLATLVGGRILVLHGGIGDGQWDLSHLMNTKRPLPSDVLSQDPVVYNVLWSDPVDEDHADGFGIHSSPRDQHEDLILRFGKDITDSFCERNGVSMIVRSHEAEKGGCGYEVMHGGRLVRVFSARDYENNGNDGAILAIDKYPNEKKFLVRPQLLQSLMKHNPRQIAEDVPISARSDRRGGAPGWHGDGPPLES